jgi:hypothetical protein
MPPPRNNPAQNSVQISCLSQKATTPLAYRLRPGVGFPPYEGNSGDYNSTNYGPVTSSSDIGDGTPKGANSCYDGNTQSSPVLPEQYSVEVNGGADANCVLSFRFQ